MLCDKCKKNTATVFYKQVINGEVTEMNLCADCANSMGTKMSMSFDNIFQGFLDGFLGNEVPNKSNSHVFKCPSCSTTFEDFRNTGRFGCVDCYNTFREQILHSILVRFSLPVSLWVREEEPILMTIRFLSFNLSR